MGDFSNDFSNDFNITRAMTKEELKALIIKNIIGQGNQIDHGTVLPAIFNELIDRSFRSATSFISLERLRKYLYRVTFDKVGYSENVPAPVTNGCSAYVQNGKLYRNLDFKYDNAASFIVRTPDFEGVAFMTGLNDGELTEDKINQLPYRVVDGRNNNGIMVSVHIIFNDWGYTGAGYKLIPLTRLPYEVLTRAKSMDTIAEDLAFVLGNLNTEGMGDYLIQMLVTDGTTTYALIPPTTDGESYVLENATEHPKMTNFRWIGQDEVTRSDEGMQERPTGIERFNAMPCTLESLRFTKCYESADRLSEFIGIDHTTKDSTDEELTVIYNKAKAVYENRERDGQTWQTMHSVIYGKQMESLYIQENWNDEIISDFVRKSEIGELANLETDHKSNIVDAVNELAEILETTELVVSLAQSSDERKAIYNLCLAHPQLAKNIVVLGSDNLYYPVNGYGFVEDILHLHIIFNGESGLEDVLLQISPNGTISV